MRRGGGGRPDSGTAVRDEDGLERLALEDEFESPCRFGQRQQKTAPAGLNAAEAHAAVAQPAKSAATLAGEYAGKWKAENEASGNVRIKLTQAADGKWSADAAFSYEGTDIATTAAIRWRFI